MKKSVLCSLLTIACITSGQASPVATQYIDQAGNHFEFSTQKESFGSTGIIETFDKEHAPLDRITDTPAGPCINGNIKDPFTISFKSERHPIVFTVLCRSNEGLATTLMIFEGGHLIGLMDTSNDDPYVNWDDQSKTYLLNIFEDIEINPNERIRILKINQFNFGDGLTGFRPIFNRYSASRYKDYYYELTNSKSKSVNELEILAALVSTGENETICREISKRPLSGLSSHSLQTSLEKLQDFGLPTFNPLSCKK